MFSLLYCSVSNLPHIHAIDDVAGLVDSAITKNEELDITGSLIYTGNHFAGALEGQEKELTELMETIRIDPRHRSVTVVYTEHRLSRRFAKWAMAYRGQSRYVDSPIEQLINAPSEKAKMQAIDRVHDLMIEFAR